MRFYVFDDQAAAQAAVDQINARARQLFQQQGYTLADDGSIIGKRVSDGTSMPNSARTQTWDVPRQRVDGKWVFHHVETCPGNRFVIDKAGTTVAQFVGQDLSTATIETEDLSWWPARAKFP